MVVIMIYDYNYDFVIFLYLIPHPEHDMAEPRAVG